MQAYNEQAYTKWDNEALQKCPHCARTFLPDRLIIHLRSCRSNSPQKRLLAGSGLGGGASGIIEDTSQVQAENLYMKLNLKQTNQSESNISDNQKSVG